MRLNNLSPSTLGQQQIKLYGMMQASIKKHLQGFVTSREDGALIGPFNILLNFPQLGASVWGLFDILANHSKLTPTVREIAILLTGARFSALYELYSHESVALRMGMAPELIASLAVGQRPANLSREENVAFDVISALLDGAQLPNSTFRLAEECFGADGLAEIGCCIGCYTTISVLLNTFDINVPETELGTQALA